ncbi:threonine synthase [Candidatus Micrarchaeota archaeon]|nr:threonine synthase [Candidatus Micrarchaeota archaeon]
MLVCAKCRRHYSEDRTHYLCACGSVMLVHRGYRQPKHHGEGLRKFKEVLPVRRQLVTLGEGSTPLHHAERLGGELGMRHLYIKFEGSNPSGSFKDRGTCVVITKALEFRAQGVVVASTGNMAASVAAYAAEASLPCKVFVPEKTPHAKLSQALAYGAKIYKVSGGFDDCVRRAKMESRHGWYIAMTGLNPYYIEGEKTIAYELAHLQPDWVIIPGGTGGLTTAVWKGFKEQKLAPKIAIVQSEGCAPIVDAFEHGDLDAKPLKEAQTISSAVLVKTPFNARTALRAVRESHGTAVRVSDIETVKAIRTIGEEGFFAEPAAAMPLPALQKLLKVGVIKKTEKVVLLVTGHGLKSPEAVSALGQKF